MNLETQRFIKEHEKEDIFTIKLQYSKNTEVDIELAIRQITGKQKVKSKVPLFYATEDFLYPAQLSLEQASSETTACYKATICNGNTLVDLTGGFGVDCYFMSCQFNQTVYVERYEKLCGLAIHNFKILKGNNIRVVHSESEKYLLEMGHADWIFIDPARRSSAGKKVVLLSDCEPDIGEIYPQLLEKASRILIKLSPMMDISAAIRDLPNAYEIHIISIENECKEVLFILNQSIRNDIQVKTINFRKNKENQTFDYYLNEETTADVSMATLVEKYLYEPNASIMKSGAFRKSGNRFKIHKLHKNTHLYTSDELIRDFPGRIFEVKSQWGNSKKELKELGIKIPKANVSIRNYPIPVDELCKKLKIKDGGDTYLFACTINDDRKVILETIKVTCNSIMS